VGWLTSSPNQLYFHAKARTAHQDFLTLWKNAEIPILKQAKAEYAKWFKPCAV
jgi:hypothetical protein